MVNFKKYIIFLLIPFFLQCNKNEVDILLSKYTPEELANFSFNAIIEPVKDTFSTIEGSEEFIEKFTLNSYEQEIIGKWGFTIIFAEPRKGKYGPGGGTITFFPNRYFVILKRWPPEVNTLQNIVGRWKVEDDKLMVQFICRLRTVDHQSRNNNEQLSVEYRKDDTYYPIYNVQKYERYYINNKPFNWKEVPREVRQFYEIKRNDSRRSRLLFDTLGTPPGDLRKESTLGNFLLNPEETNEYILQLIDKW
jgi:hypothetical protein